MVEASSSPITVRVGECMERRRREKGGGRTLGIPRMFSNLLYCSKEEGRDGRKGRLHTVLYTILYSTTLYYTSWFWYTVVVHYQSEEE